MQLPSKWKGNYLFEPVLQNEFSGYYINDFTIGNGYLAVTAGKDGKLGTGNDQYWSSLKEKAKKQIDQFKKFRIST